MPQSFRIVLQSHVRTAALALIACVGVCAIADDGFAQSLSTPQVVLFGAVGDHLAQSHIVAYDHGEACGVFTSGSGLGPAGGVGLELPLAASWSLLPALSFESATSNFSTHPSTLEHGFANGALVEIDRTRHYAATLSLLELSVAARLNLIGSLSLSAAPVLGMFTHHQFTETETIDAPSAASYAQTNFSQQRTISSGAIDVQALQAGLSLGIDYALNFGGFALRPSINANIPLTNISSSASWKAYSIGVGLAIARPMESRPIALPSAIAVAPPQPERPTGTRETAPLRVSMRVAGIDESGHEVEKPILHVERVHVTEVHPTLNALFFDVRDSAIPIRYHLYDSKNDAISFRDSDLYRSSALEINHALLDILGKRLQRSPTATLTISGTASPAEVAPLLNGSLEGRLSLIAASLGASRARAVAHYLTTVWGIAPSRLLIKSRARPEFPSDESTATGQAENRRVELTSNDPSILAPLWTMRTERVASPPKIMFYPRIVQRHGIDSLTITVSQGGRILQRFDGRSDGSAGEHLWTLDEASSPTTDDSLMYVCRVVDSAGNVATSTGSIAIAHEVHESTEHQSSLSDGKRLERYSLILFDYSSSQFEKEQSARLIDTIARTADANATLTLTGHTDQTGDPAFNDRLSGERATVVAEALRSAWTKARRTKPAMSIEAHGSRDILFDNSLPEGRFLSRTVRIMVEHPQSTKEVAR